MLVHYIVHLPMFTWSIEIVAAFLEQPLYHPPNLAICDLVTHCAHRFKLRLYREKHTPLFHCQALSWTTEGKHETRNPANTILPLACTWLSNHVVANPASFLAVSLELGPVISFLHDRKIVDIPMVTVYCQDKCKHFPSSWHKLKQISSVFVNSLVAYAAGCSACMRTAPKSFVNASSV